MPRTIIVFAIALFYLVAFTGCGGTTPAAPASQPTSNATSAAPVVSTRAPIPLPPQPTAPPATPRAAVPFASATSAPIVSVPLTVGPSSPTVVVAATSAPAVVTQAPVAGPTAPGVATGVRSEIKVEFVDPLETAEVADEIAIALKRAPGILGASGNEYTLTIVYDAGLILPNQIRQRLATLGHAVKP